MLRTQGIWFPWLLPEETTRGKTSINNIINGETMAWQKAGGGQESACQCRGHRFDPCSEETPHASTRPSATKPVCNNHWAPALEPENPNYWAHTLQLLEPACPPRTWTLQQKKPLHHSWTVAPHAEPRPSAGKGQSVCKFLKLCKDWALNLRLSGCRREGKNNVTGKG